MKEYINEDAVEEEVDSKDGQSSLMEKPFDPTLINIDTKTPSLDTLIERIRHDEIVLKTESYFQREADLWSKEQQSRLIESILIRFPLPAFYFDGSDTKKWLVVDGLQRLSSIRNFVVEKNLSLTGLEFLTKLEGKKYDDLDRDLQRTIKEAQVVTYIINPGTPVDVKFNIFKRINTGGIPLTPQEIRHALFQGKPAEFIAELAECKEFGEATGEALSQNKRMLARDFANRFLCFYLFGYTKYEPDLDTFMSKAMAAIKHLSDVEIQKIKANFIASMILNFHVFGKDAFRKIGDSDKRKPINKAIFDVFSVKFAILSESERKNIESKKEIVKCKFWDILKNDTTFIEAISSSTDNKNKVTYRHKTVDNLINSIIKS